MRSNVPILLTVLLPLLILCSHCAGNGSGEKNDTALDSTAGLRPQGKEASRNDTVVISLLTDICGMGYGEAMAVDDDAARLGKEKAEASTILTTTAARFSESDKGFCKAEGEITNNGFLTGAIMVLNLKADRITAARFDSEAGNLEVWTEEPGEEWPEIIDEWIEQYQGRPETED